MTPEGGREETNSIMKPKITLNNLDKIQLNQESNPELTPPGITSTELKINDMTNDGQKVQVKSSQEKTQRAAEDSGERSVDSKYARFTGKQTKTEAIYPNIKPKHENDPNYINSLKLKLTPPP